MIHHGLLPFGAHTPPTIYNGKIAKRIPPVKTSFGNFKVSYVQCSPEWAAEATSAILMASLVAADEVAAPVEEVKKSVVTGTRIERSQPLAYAHVVVVTSDDIKMSGATTIDELLNKLPFMSLGGINRQKNNGGQGLIALEMRNLGINRMLVLINGRRMVQSGEAGGFVDINNILPKIENIFFCIYHSLPHTLILSNYL